MDKEKFCRGLSGEVVRSGKFCFVWVGKLLIQEGFVVPGGESLVVVCQEKVTYPGKLFNSPGRKIYYETKKVFALSRQEKLIVQEGLLLAWKKYVIKKIYLVSWREKNLSPREVPSE